MNKNEKLLSFLSVVALITVIVFYMIIESWCIYTNHTSSTTNNIDYSKEITQLKEQFQSFKNNQVQVEDTVLLNKFSGNITTLSNDIKSISSSVDLLKKEINTSVENSDTKINSMKTNLERMERIDIDTRNKIEIVNKTIDNVIVELTLVKKNSDEDRKKIELLIEEMKGVKEFVKTMQDQINDIKLMYTNYNPVLKLQKQGVNYIGEVLK